VTRFITHLKYIYIYIELTWVRVRFIVFNATFNNISVISWWSVLLVEETGVPMQSVPITTNVLNSNTVHGEVYSIQHYVTKFVSDLRQVSGFLWVLRFHPPIKLTAMI